MIVLHGGEVRAAPYMPNYILQCLRSCVRQQPHDACEKHRRHTPHHLVFPVIVIDHTFAIRAEDERNVVRQRTVELEIGHMQMPHFAELNSVCVLHHDVLGHAKTGFSG